MTIDKALLDPQAGPYAATELVSGQPCADASTAGQVAFTVDIPVGTVVAVAAEVGE